MDYYLPELNKEHNLWRGIDDWWRMSGKPRVLLDVHDGL